MGVQISDGYRELAPPSGLRKALECLWVRVFPSNGGPPIRILPDACSDLNGPHQRMAEGAKALGWSLPASRSRWRPTAIPAARRLRHFCWP